MSKFLLNLLVQISKSLVYSEFQFLIRKFFFLISARPPPLFFSSPAAAHLLPPGLAQSDRTGPFSKLVRVRYLSIFSTSKLVRFGLKTCPIWSLRPQAAARVLGPLGPLDPSHIGVFAERRILLDFAHSGRDTFSLSRHCHVGPACQLHPLPPPLADHCHSSPLAIPRRPASNLEVPGEVFTPRLDFPRNFTP
jgi:hypothetical protein